MLLDSEGAPFQPLLESEMDPDPFQEFKRWLEKAAGAGLVEPYAMTLATADKSGAPSSRVVLLRGWDERGLAFYTNYESRKARELIENPRASLCFWWGPLRRQVRVRGTVAKTSADESEAYFRTRPRGSQLGAWISEQSRPIAGREALEKELAALEKKYEGKDVPCPPFWGGFRLAPSEYEFWQQGPHRLHDRLLYTRDGEQWKITRLAP